MTAVPASRSAAKSTAARKAAAKPAKRPAGTSGHGPRPAKAEKKTRPKKDKLIRDGFTIPESEYGLIAAVKSRCLAKGLAVKKSEVLRAAIIGFAAQSDAKLVAALKAIEVLKTGRPPKDRK